MSSGIDTFVKALLNLSGKKWSSLRGTIIIIEGIIGVGKTTLCKSLHNFLTELGHDVVWFPEKIPSSLISLYISDMKRYAFPFQVMVAQSRALDLSRACELAKMGKIVIMDRSLLGDCAFALMQKEKGYFTDAEFEAYLGVVSTGQPVSSPPLHILYLESSPETAFERMKKRGNKDEIDGYTLDYFKELSATYARMIEHGEEKITTLPWSDRNIADGVLANDEICTEILNLLADKR